MLDAILKAIKRTERTVALANTAIKVVEKVSQVAPANPAWDEVWRRWNNVPTSDLRGQHHAMLHFMAEAFEGKLPPWKRWRCKSNGRWVQGRRAVVRPIRGIHIRTKGDKDCTLPRFRSDRGEVR